MLIEPLRADPSDQPCTLNRRDDASPLGSSYEPAGWWSTRKLDIVAGRASSPAEHSTSFYDATAVQTTQIDASPIICGCLIGLSVHEPRHVGLAPATTGGDLRSGSHSAVIVISGRQKFELHVRSLGRALRSGSRWILHVCCTKPWRRRTGPDQYLSHCRNHLCSN